MHDCIYCGRACDCDCDDTWLNTPDDCIGCGDPECSGEAEWTEEELEEWEDYKRQVIIHALFMGVGLL